MVNCPINAEVMKPNVCMCPINPGALSWVYFVNALCYRKLTGWLAGHVRKRQFREICPTPVPKVLLYELVLQETARCKAAAAQTSPDICSQIGSDTGRFTILMEIHKAIRPPLEKCSSVLALPGEFALRAISGPVCMRRFMSPEPVPY